MIGCDLQVVFEGMVGQCGVVGFDVEFEVFVQFVFFQEVYYCGIVEVVLVFYWFYWFGFDQEVVFQFDVVVIVVCYGQEVCEMFDFLFYLGIGQ